MGVMITSVRLDPQGRVGIVFARSPVGSDEEKCPYLISEVLDHLLECGQDCANGGKTWIGTWIITGDVHWGAGKGKSNM